MARHRGKFDPQNTSPYELSRSKIEAFIKCSACFWLEKAAGVKFPGMLDTENPFLATVRFNVAVIPCEGNDDWVENALEQAKACLLQTHCPEHSESCEYDAFINAINDAANRTARVVE